MDIIGNFEKEFLKTIGIEAIRSDTGIYTLKTNSNEVFKYKGEDEVGIDTFYDYASGKKRIWLSIGQENTTGIMSRKTQILKDDLNCSFTETRTAYGAVFLNACFLDRNSGICTIEIEPYPSAHYFEVYIRNDKKKRYPNCVVVDLFGIKGFEMEMFQSKQTYGPLVLNVDNFEMVLKGMINKMYDLDEKAKEFFLKLMPLFRSIYHEYEKIPMEYIGEYLKEVEKEREEINRKANSQIELINEERNTELQKNYEKVLKMTAMTNRQKTR